MNPSLAMGGYAGYLSVAYGVTAVVVIGNIVAARRRFRSTHQRLSEQLGRREGRRGASAAVSDQMGNQKGSESSSAATVGRRS